ncbi:MAG: PaaI family thioesterase, partial [Desulfosarcinaceae bacterium]
MSFQVQDLNYVQKVCDSFNCQQFMHTLGANLERVEPGLCEIRLPFKPELSQQDGYFHAGVITTLADNASGYAAFSLMAPDAAVLTVEFKMNFLAPGDGDALVARGQVVKAGRTLTICRSEVFNLKNNQEHLC